MSDEKRILRAVVQSERGHHSTHADYVFWCPGCKCGHGIWTTKRNGLGAVWAFDGNMERPTFNPSLLITGKQPLTDAEADLVMKGGPFTPKPLCCHTFIRDGQIQFLPDCTHELAGKTVPMEAF